MKKTIKFLVNKAGFEVRRRDVSAVPLMPLKTDGDLAFYETPLGDYYLPLNAEKDVIAYHMRNGLIFEPEVIDIARRFIKKGSAVLDIGANFGQMSILFSAMADEDGRVFSFEAQKKVFDVLEKNILVNNISNITPMFNAVYFESNKTFYFPEPDFVKFDCYGSYNLPLDAVSGQKVESLKIDDLQIEKTISFMKVDVQGCDLFAMLGAKETIKKHKMPILFEFEQQFQETYNTSFQDYSEFVDSIGYKFVEIIMGRNYLIVPV